MNDKLNIHMNEMNDALKKNHILEQPIETSTQQRMIETKRSSGNSIYDIRPNSCQSSLVSEFDSIYKEGKWAGKILNPTEYYNNANWPPQLIHSASGGGSNRGEATINSMDFLRHIINQYNISSMIDLPCGDANWIFDSYETDSLLTLYIGLDIVKDVIESNKLRYHHHNNKLFFHWDGSNCPLPKYIDTTSSMDDTIEYAIDMIHTRDVLQHIPLNDGILFVCNIFQSGAKYLITTTFPTTESNTNITQGNFFGNNLDLPPFDIPKSSHCIDTHINIEPDQTCLYDLTQSWTPLWIEEHCK